MDEETDFQISGREPLMWLESARRLKYTAGVLEAEVIAVVAEYRTSNASGDDIFIVYPYLMMCGMAIENLLKGILIARDPSVIETDRLNPKTWSGGEHPHDVLHLAKKARLTLSQEEQDFLIRVSEAVLWHGRYPIPMKGMRLEKKALLRDGHRSRRSFTMDDPESFKSLYERLEAQLRAEADEAESVRRRADWKTVQEGG